MFITVQPDGKITLIFGSVAMARAWKTVLSSLEQAILGRGHLFSEMCGSAKAGTGRDNLIVATVG
ncbi:hypothetical protein [Maribacter sp. 2307ULW6-5]|uniref:hypothetical protein n=1 Tax=Maribacter sp. 2307ULW6-5 TaxID=3386275 RepID=UPI0039BC8A5F